MQLSGEMAALCTSLFWTVSSLSFTAASNRISSSVVNHARLWFALIVLLFIHTLLYDTFFPFNKAFDHYLYLGLSGLIGFTIGDAFLFEAFVLLNTRLTMTIMAVSPIFSLIISWIILKEQLSAFDSAAILITILAVMWVVSEKQKSSDDKKYKNLSLGIVLAIGSALCQAFGVLFAKMGMNNNFPPISANIIRLTSGTFFMFVFVLLRGKLFYQIKKLHDIKAFGFIALGSFAGPIFGVLFSLYAITHTQLGIASTLMALSPILLIPLSHIIHKEKITIRTIIGTVIAIAGASSLTFF